MKITATFAVLAALAAAPSALAAEMKMDTAPPAGAADKAFSESMQKMMKDMDTKPTGNPDKDFVMMMMPHHQGAIDMAKVELQYGNDPMLRSLATAIVKAQETEIAEMKAWIAKHRK